MSLIKQLKVCIDIAIVFIYFFLVWKSMAIPPTVWSSPFFEISYF